MPGFGLAADRNGLDQQLATRIARASASMCHDARYAVREVASSAHVHLSFVAYPEYPVQVEVQDATTLLIEGMVYSQPPPIVPDLCRLLSESATPEATAAAISDIAAASDGDFVIVAITAPPHHAVFISSDVLGRLPVFWSFDSGRLLVSREPKFIRVLCGGKRPDRLGVAQSLVFGFPWGDRTTSEGVFRLPPGAVLCWKIDGDLPPQVLNQRPWAADKREWTGGFQECTARLSTELIASTARRAALTGDRNVVSLSGGMDSRAVAGSLHRAGIRAVARTFVYGRQYGDREAGIAARIAELCGFPHAVVRLSEPPLATANRLIRMTDGRNSGAMAYADEYLSEIVSEHGSGAVLWTGEGGDLVMPERRPHQRIGSDDNLIGLMFDRAAAFTSEQIGAIFGFSPGFMAEQLRHFVDTFPESDQADRYLRMVWEYQRQAYFDGEDRNRCYLWVVAPFYGRPCFELALGAPSTWKKRRRLYGHLIRRIHERLVDVPVSNTGLRIGAPFDRARQHLRDLVQGHRWLETLHTRWRGAVQRRSRRPGEELTSALTRLLEDSSAVSAMVSIKASKALVSNGLSASQSWLLYTLLLNASETAPEVSPGT